MASPFVKKLSKELGIPERDINKYWDSAKEITSDMFGVPENKFSSKEYNYAIELIKSKLGIHEERIKPIDFLSTDKSVDVFLNEVLEKEKQVVLKENFDMED